MNRLVRTWVLVALCGLSCVLLSIDVARADRKVALVVGNTQYRNPGLVLPNPRNDAEDTADALGLSDERTAAYEAAGLGALDVLLTRPEPAAVR